VDDGETIPDDDGACSASAPEDMLPLLDAPAAIPAEEARGTAILQEELPLEVARARVRTERARRNATQVLADRLARQARAQERRRVTGKRKSPAFPQPQYRSVEGAAEEEEAEEGEAIVEAQARKAPQQLQSPVQGGGPNTLQRWATFSGTPTGSSGGTPSRLNRGTVKHLPVPVFLQGSVPAFANSMSQQGKLKEPFSQPRNTVRRRWVVDVD